MRKGRRIVNSKDSRMSVSEQKAEEEENEASKDDNKYGLLPSLKN